MINKNLPSLFEFSREIDKEKTIIRRTYITDAVRRETDSEHSWHAALMALLFADYSKEPIDRLRTVEMLLIHDLVEIYAGDTYAYDEKVAENQHSREEKAADKIFGLLPEEKRDYYIALWNEFEDGKTSEAGFARAMDNIQPVMQNDMTDGKAWRENGVYLSQILKRNEITKSAAPELWDYVLNSFIIPNVESGAIKNQEKEI